MGTRFDITKVKSWETTTHREAARILGCSYARANQLRRDLDLPKAPPGQLGRGPHATRTTRQSHASRGTKSRTGACASLRLHGLSGAAGRRSGNTSGNTGEHYEKTDLEIQRRKSRILECDSRARHPIISRASAMAGHNQPESSSRRTRRCFL